MGVLVLTTFEGVDATRSEAKLEALAAAALELRKQDPYATLVVAAPERLVRELQRRYPPLVDVVITSPEGLGEFQGKNRIAGEAAEE